MSNPMESKTAAQQLFEDKFPVAQYEDLQNRRQERLNMWLDKRIPFLAKQEMQLIAYGEEVLTELKRLYGNV